MVLFVTIGILYHMGAAIFLIYNSETYKIEVFLLLKQNYVIETFIVIQLSCFKDLQKGGVSIRSIRVVSYDSLMYFYNMAPIQG